MISNLEDSSNKIVVDAENQAKSNTKCGGNDEKNNEAEKTETKDESDTLEELRRLARTDLTAKEVANRDAASLHVDIPTTTFDSNEQERRANDKRQVEEEEMASLLETLREAQELGVQAIFGMMIERMKHMDKIRTVHSFRINYVMRPTSPQNSKDQYFLKRQKERERLKKMRTGPAWQGPNEALKRLRDDPMHGVFPESDLGGAPAVPWSIMRRDSPIMGDKGNSEANHLSQGDYPGAHPYH